MNDKMYKTLEYDKILEKLQEFALSERARMKIQALVPFLSVAEVNRHLAETTEGRIVIEHAGTPPLSPMTDLIKTLSLVGKGSLLVPNQLENVAQFLTSCRRLKAYLKKAEVTSTSVAQYGNSIVDLTTLEDEIKRVIRGDQIDDRATPLLANIRRKIINAGTQIKSKLDSLLRNNSQWFSEHFVSIRNGRYTLPVKKEFKSRVAGTVIDMSQSGGTYFIEPAQATKLQDEVSLLEIEEENEVRRILYTLTAQVEENLISIRLNIEAMETLDFIFAKARLSIAMKAISPEITTARKIIIKAGRHPLLKSDHVVPLNFAIGDGIHGMVITGPNTGGKTVALKTIGLLSLMAQSGLHVPAEEALFTMNNYILCDIGDGQSIAENLSTFSAHMTNMIDILRLADDQSLVLLDELGSGTDPAEGMGLGVAILEELLRKNSLFVATCHYPEIKTFAHETRGLVNAKMAFDRQTLLPLYRLEIGKAGESCALHIATRLGLPRHLIQRAAQAAYGMDGTKREASTVNFNSAITKADLTTAEKNIKNSEVDNSKGEPISVNQAASSNDRSITGSQAASTGSSPQPDEPLHQKNRIQADQPRKPSQPPRSMRFNIGDSVLVYPQKVIGIVYQKANGKGEVGVQVKKKKLLVNHKRIKLQVPASELYPENYDFSILFDSVANRKARHVLERKHDPNMIIEISNNEGNES